jgi:uncharacterized protein YkwD
MRLSSRLLPLGVVCALALPLAAAAFAPRESGLQDVPIAVTAITAAEIRGPSPLERAVLGEINTLRRDPAGYAVNLRGLRGTNSPIYINAAIEALERAPPVPALNFNPSLSSVAVIHANYLGPLGQMGHTGPGGRTLGTRYRDQGWITTLPAEDIAVGRPVARQLVVNLVIDSGVTGAPHRRDLLNPVFTFAGVGCAPHTQYGAICVVNLSNPPMQHRGWEEEFIGSSRAEPKYRFKTGPLVSTPLPTDASLMDDRSERPRPDRPLPPQPYKPVFTPQPFTVEAPY